MESAQLRAHLEDGLHRGVVHVDADVGELADGVGNADALVLVEESEAQAVAVDLRLGGEEAEGELLAPHLEAEGGDDGAVSGGVAGDVHREGGLSDGGSRSEDDEVAALEASERAVDVGESGGDGGVAVVARVGGVDAGEVLVEHLAEGDEVAGGVGVADAEEDVFGLLEGEIDVGGVGVADGCDVGGGLDESAQGGRLVDDLGVVLGVEGGGHAGDEGAEVGLSADALEALLEEELAGDADLVDGLAALVEGVAGFVAVAVGLAVEVLGADERRYAVDRLPVDEQGADDRLFRVGVMWWELLRVHRLSRYACSGSSS